MIKELVNKLQIDENFHAAEEISSILKQQIQGDKGLIRKVKEQTENYRKSSLKTLIEEFANNRSNGFTDLDEQLNIFCNEMKKINDQAYAKLSYDYINLFANLTDIEKEYPEYHYVSQIITDEINHPPHIRWRLQGIIASHVGLSIGQGKKAMAGKAGEDLVKACLGRIGLIEEQKDYRSQWKSSKGSDTDFVIPYAEDNDMSKIKVFIAAQLSSNDRARMASSELHPGAQKYLVTGNGMDSSTKSINDIGAEIISSYQSANIKIVCRKSHVDKLIKELEEKNNESNKLEYLKNYLLSFEQFAHEIYHQFVK